MRRLGWAAAALVALLLVAVVVAAFGPLPGAVLGKTADRLGPADLVRARTDVRTSLLQAVGGVLLVIGGLTGWRQMLISRRQHLLSRRIAVTDTFTKALEQLSDGKSAAIRLGGVYSLDRIADDDPGERGRICEILATFVRESAGAGDRPSRDVAGALAVLTRRDWPQGVDLAGARLTAARLPDARLVGGRLRGAELTGANLARAVLRRADLTGADLRRADLCGADLREARLAGARLSGAAADARTRWPDGFDPAGQGVLSNAHPAIDRTSPAPP